MATAQRKIAQFARIVCQICDKENDVEWKCTQCEEVMCNDCKIAHSRMKMSRDHTVTTLRESMPSASPQSDTATYGAKYCSHHPMELLLMYCADCRMTICLDCLSSDHKKHEAVKISKVVEEKRQELSDVIAQSKSKLSTFETGMKALRKNMDDNSEKSQKAITLVKQQRDELKSKVDGEAEGIIIDIIKEELENRERLESVQKKIESKVKKIKQFISECEKKLSNQYDTALVGTVEESKRRGDSFRSYQGHATLQQSAFVLGNKDLLDVRTVIGYLQQNKSTNQSTVTSDVELPRSITRATLVTSFPTSVPSSCVADVDNTKAWFGNRWGRTELALVSNDGKGKQRIKLNFILRDIAVTPSGDLLVTEVYGHHIKHLTLRGQFVDITNTEPFITHGLHVTQDNDVLVCLYNTESKQGKVTRMSITGHIQQEIQYGRQNRALFTEPHNVSQNINQDVCVVDVGINSDYSLVVTDKYGQVKFRYKGQPGSKCCYFYDVVCDVSGCILLSDKRNNRIHQIDKDGRFIKFILTERDGINNPWGLSIDKRRQLWICNISDDNNVMLFKLD